MVGAGASFTTLRCAGIAEFTPRIVRVLG